jgi:DNA-binding beta-propeller fold protein YncE
LLLPVSKECAATFINDSTGSKVVKVDAAGRIKKLAQVEGPVGMVLARSGDLYVAQPKPGKLSQIKPDGTTVVVLQGLRGPRDPVFDASGQLYVAETDSGRILKLSGRHC